jgi:anti-sigma regulatory factor (Ser/Thr protein kinase)
VTPAAPPPGAPPDSWVLPLSRAPRAARDARSAARSVLHDWGMPEPTCDDAIAIIGELVANAVVHAGGAVELTLRRDARRLHVGVSDADAMHSPQPFLAATTADHGRGLLIVTRLAGAWGWAVDPPAGKTVWADLPLPDGVAAPPARCAV